MRASNGSKPPAAAREQVVQKVRELAAVFNPAQRPQSLSELSATVASHLRHLRRLDGDTQIAALLGTRFAGHQTDTRDLASLASLAKLIAALGLGAESVARVSFERPRG